MVLTIVVVDCDQILLDLMYNILNDEGYRSLIWKGCAGAFEFIRREQPDLVVVDGWMEHPDDAWELIEQITTDPSTRHIPVIAASTDPAFLRDKDSVLRQNGHVVLAKPFDIDQLIATVARLLGPERRSRRP